MWLRIWAGSTPRPRSLRRVRGLLTTALAAATLGVATQAAAQALRVPTPGPLVYVWLDAATWRSRIYVKWPDEPDARVIYDELGFIFEAKWSPDGEQIGIADYGLRVMDADGLNLRILADADFRGVPSFTWGPGDREITYYKSKAWADGDLWVFDVRDPDNERRLTRQGGRYGEPAWSPDRSRIAYSWGPMRAGVLHVMDADGGNIVRVTKGRDPAWSPDGKRLVYGGNRDALATDIYVVDAREGAIPQRLTDAPEYKYTPVWLAQGPWIAYGVSGDMHLVSPDGRETHNLGVRKGEPAITSFDWYDPFLAVSAAGRLPSRWGSLKTSGAR